MADHARVEWRVPRPGLSSQTPSPAATALSAQVDMLASLQQNNRLQFGTVGLFFSKARTDILDRFL